MATVSLTPFVVGEDGDPAFADANHAEDIALLENELAVATSHIAATRTYQELCRFRIFAESLLVHHLTYQRSAALAFRNIFLRAHSATEGLEHAPIPDIEKNVQELRIAFRTQCIRFTPPDPQSSPDDL